MKWLGWLIFKIKYDQIEKKKCFQKSWYSRLITENIYNRISFLCYNTQNITVKLLPVHY
jgi:hypothetical protein